MLTFIATLIASTFAIAGKREDKSRRRERRKSSNEEVAGRRLVSGSHSRIPMLEYYAQIPRRIAPANEKKKK